MATDDDFFPPGDLLREELAERGWGVDFFSVKSGLTTDRINLILDGGAIELDSATAIGKALGTSPTFWMNLQRLHDEDLASKGGTKLAS